jgi:hypothetical protein
MSLLPFTLSFLPFPNRPVADSTHFGYKRVTALTYSPLKPNPYLTILLLLLLLLLAVSFEVIQAWSLRKAEITFVGVSRNKNMDTPISVNFRI